MIRCLADLGAHLTVVYPTVEKQSQETVEQAFNHAHNLIFKPVAFVDTGRLPGHYVRANRAYSALACKTMLPELDTFDLIYAQGFTGRSFLDLRAKGRLKAPVIVNLHGFEMFQPAANFKHRVANTWLRREAAYSLLQADYVYSFGGKLTLLLEQLGIPRSRILLQSNGIDDRWMAKAPSKNREIRTFVFIGRNERRKGMKELVVALHELVQHHVPFNFHFIGDIDEADRLSYPNLTYHGIVREPDKIMNMLDACDCLVIPSHSEGMPTVILEAMARGLAVIGTHVGAVGRMIEGNGLMLERPDPRLISAAISEVVNMSDDALSMLKIQSLELIKNQFRWSQVAAQQWLDFQKITGKS